MNDKHKHIDGREFVSLVTVNQRRIFTYILALVPNLSDAEDIMQETATFMWENKEKYIPGTDFVAWGVRVAYYRILEYRKKKNKDRMMVIMNEQISEIEEVVKKKNDNTEEMLAKLKECQKTLSAPDKQLMHLKYTMELSASDIANRINKSIRSVYLKISRVQLMLLNCIERYES